MKNKITISARMAITVMLDVTALTLLVLAASSAIAFAVTPSYLVNHDLLTVTLAQVFTYVFTPIIVVVSLVYLWEEGPCITISKDMFTRGRKNNLPRATIKR